MQKKVRERRRVNDIFDVLFLIHSGHRGRINNNDCHMTQSTFNTMIPQKNSFRASLKMVISNCNVIDDDDFHTNLYVFF